MNNIRFFTEDIHFALKDKIKLRQWIADTIRKQNKQLHSINYIFVSDDYLLKVNQNYLNHDTLTDIITFNQSSNPTYIEADIFISIPRVKENAKNIGIPFNDELHRVMIHGVLHILGYSDKTPREKNEMRKKENHYLALRFN